jgi:hypothetical protein
VDDPQLFGVNLLTLFCKLYRFKGIQQNAWFLKMTWLIKKKE